MLCCISFYTLFLSRAELLGLYEQVILNDIEYSDSQNVDQALWKNVFYQVIERFRQLLKEPAYDSTSHIRNMLLTLLDEVKSVWEIVSGLLLTYVKDWQYKSRSEKLHEKSVISIEEVVIVYSL